MNKLGIVSGLALMLAVLATNAQAQDSATDSTAEKQTNTEELRQQIVAKGLKYFSEKGQAENGSFTEKAGAGITALAVTSALRNGLSVDDPMVAKGLEALNGFVKPDGGIYGGGRLKNYETCVAVVALSLANDSGKYNKTLANAQAFLKGLQVDGADRKPDDPWYGGVGYGGSGRPDLSNTAYFVEALIATGADEDDESIQRAITFISRCQNLEGHGNDTRFADLVKDGGFYYSIPTESSDASSETERITANGGLRSYGSMTYSGFKSMIYAGLTKENPRVEAATTWIENTYSVEKNPGMGTAGLFYYFHTFSSALNAAGMEKVVDKDGEAHDWRADLITQLAELQNDDGSWTNEDRRWFENDPNLSTGFALLALSYCKPAAETPATDAGK
ncbi:prenyltransferase/squalene oxidase repeat-containing protein [Mariniblastus fucicola]|uniref:Squalene cyclase C-terminal domain-containing protein n=1 Tax=Mariniblastus fucicola TaxID=980251 RepID=A0A5B9PHZ3_9BACT|nr:prenyltransferase/squalene oxidase repeat-containing protein [Mariniblastus fucicola]QEG22451.1 hypothetical protein MFFC18_23310 [Mariniblastus fucicola]